MSLFGAVWREDPHDDDLKYLKRGKNPWFTTVFFQDSTGFTAFSGARG